MSALTEFLQARFVDDIAAARDAMGGEASVTPDFTVTGWPACEYPGRVVVVGLERFVADIEAKAVVVGLHAPDHLEPDICTTCASANELYPCRTIRALASVYADHPDYQQGWKP